LERELNENRTKKGTNTEGEKVKKLTWLLRPSNMNRWSVFLRLHTSFPAYEMFSFNWNVA